MSTTLFESFTLPRLMILACALLTLTLLVVAPLILPHVTAAESNAVTTPAPALSSASGIQAPSRHAKPSAAHHAVRAKAPAKTPIDSQPEPATTIE